jgi:hypothetical protein
METTCFREVLMKTVWALAALSSCLVGLAARAADDPQLGHWSLDLKRSKYVTAQLPQASEATLTPYGDGVTLKVDMVNAAGQKAHIEYSARYDGKPYPRIETGAGATQGQTVTLKRTGPRSVERIVYLGDKPVGAETWVISEDGATRTVTQSGIDVHGKPINNLQIYVKR